MKSIKAYMTVFAISLAAASGVHGQSDGMKGMDMKGMDVKDMPKDIKGMKADKQSRIHKGSGTVQKIDAAKGTVTIAHGPVKTINWPAMTMTFTARDKAMLTKIKPGAKVDFGFVQSGKDYVVTEIKGQ